MHLDDDNNKSIKLSKKKKPTNQLNYQKGKGCVRCKQEEHVYICHPTPRKIVRHFEVYKHHQISGKNCVV